MVIRSWRRSLTHNLRMTHRLRSVKGKNIFLLFPSMIFIVRLMPNVRCHHTFSGTSHWIRLVFPLPLIEPIWMIDDSIVPHGMNIYIDPSIPPIMLSLKMVDQWHISRLHSGDRRVKAELTRNSEARIEYPSRMIFLIPKVDLADLFLASTNMNTRECDGCAL